MARPVEEPTRIKDEALMHEGLKESGHVGLGYVEYQKSINMLWGKG